MKNKWKESVAPSIELDKKHIFLQNDLELKLGHVYLLLVMPWHESRESSPLNLPEIIRNMNINNFWTKNIRNKQHLTNITNQKHMKNLIKSPGERIILSQC